MHLAKTYLIKMEAKLVFDIWRNNENLNVSSNEKPNAAFWQIKFFRFNFL